jgi:hypothetical protein
MIDKPQLLAYTKTVAQKLNAHEAHATFSRFMCKCLPLIFTYLPDAGISAADVAADYWLNGQRTSEDLEAARVQCWIYLDGKGRGSTIKDEEDAAMRAVICTLYAEPESEDFWTDSMEWFATMLDRIGDYSGEVALLTE